MFVPDVPSTFAIAVSHCIAGYCHLADSAEPYIYLLTSTCFHSSYGSKSLGVVCELLLIY